MPDRLKLGIKRDMKLRRDMASLEVENQSHSAGMLHGHAKVDSHARSDLPLGQFLTRLHLVVEDKIRTSKRLKRFKFGVTSDLANNSKGDL